MIAGRTEGIETVRSDGDNERVNRIMIPDLNSIEGWASGKPEIRLHVISSALSTEIATQFFNPDRSVVKNQQWWNLDEVGNLFPWYWADYGNFLIFHWIEEDSGATETTSYTSNGITYSIAKDSGDDDMGKKPVNKLDDIETHFNTGVIEWYSDAY